VAPDDTPQPDEKMPAADEVRKLAQNALDAVKVAQQRLQHDAGILFADRERLNADRTKIGQLEKDLLKLKHELEVRQAEFAASVERLAHDRQGMEVSLANLATRQQELSDREQRCATVQREIEGRQKAHETAAKSLAERERALKQADQQLADRARELGPRFKELESRELQLAGRAEQLETFAAELTETREALAAVQDQLARGQQEIAAQRDELLQRLGGVPSFPLKPAVDHAGTSAGRLPAADVTKPKPAADAAAEQFRKLRRDAKRKAIGA